MTDDLFDRDDEVRAWMRALAAIPVDDGLAPDGQQLWLKAELLRQWDAQRRTVAPIDRAEPIQVTIGLVGAVALLATLWEHAPGPNLTLVLATILGLMLIVGIAAITLRQS